LPLDLGDLHSSPLSQTQSAQFRVIALRPGATTITAEIYRGDTFETMLEATIQVIGLEEATLLDSNIKAEPRPVSQPDLVLQVQTLWNETATTCTFCYQLRSFRATSFLSAGVSYQSPPLSGCWLTQVNNLLQTTLETISDSLPTDGRAHLTSLGKSLFKKLFPIDLQTDLRQLNRYQSHTLMILADQDAQFPWTLLHNGQEFLGERFIIGHWLWDLNNAQPYEFPVGAINLAHYANIEQPELWTTLLEPPGAPPASILTGGVLDDLADLDAMRGLHLLRIGQSTADAARQDAPVLLDAAIAEPDLAQKVRPIKLNLRRNRPLVTLGYLRSDQPELTYLQQTWAATFIRAGCSAFVGSLWAVNPATEAAFISSFYHALWIGDSLGGAFQTAQRSARATVPDSLDWLAYLLFGDPMARPYRPVQGQGYAVVEPIGQDIADPVSPGTTLRFRVSLRRTPPVWHEERVIEVAETLTFNDLQAHIVTFGLQVTPATSIPLRPTPSGNYLGWFNLSVPPDITGDSALVQVYFADGMQTVHTLTFPLTFQSVGGQPE
jgi:CHAT domain